jgi:hypothetical protein
MCTAGDHRNLRQGFLMPELHELKVRIQAVERQVDGMLLKNLAERLSAVEEKLRASH